MSSLINEKDLFNSLDNLSTDKKVLVVGDIGIDKYIYGEVDRISPEAPVQVINVCNESMVLGGAGNVINNLKVLGSNVDVIGVIGNDENAIKLKDLLISINVDTKYLITEDNRITSKKSRVIASQQQVVRYDHESINEISRTSQKLILETFKKIRPILYKGSGTLKIGMMGFYPGKKNRKRLDIAIAVLYKLVSINWTLSPGIPINLLI